MGRSREIISALNCNFRYAYHTEVKGKCAIHPFQFKLMEQKIQQVFMVNTSVISCNPLNLNTNIRCERQVFTGPQLFKRWITLSTGTFH